MTGKEFFSFCFGVAIGAGVTYYLMKDSVQQEIDKINDIERNDETKKDKEEEKEPSTVKRDDDDILKMAKKAAEDLIKTEKYSYKQSAKPENGPHPIGLADFGAIDGYKEAILVRYNNGVIIDEEDDPIDTNKILGGDLSEYFDNGADIIYIRNDELKTDYTVNREDSDYIFDSETNEIAHMTNVQKGVEYYEDEEEDD